MEDYIKQIILGFLGILICLVQAQNTEKLLLNGTGLYPRLIRLEHSGDANGRLLAGVVIPPLGDEGGISLIFESLDEGETWSTEPVGIVSDPEAATGLCCHTLFELPQALGDLDAGTLLWAASIGQQSSPRYMKLKVWQSTDLGQSWSYLSTCAQGQGGLWEPEFSLDETGQLVCHFADETRQDQYSQALIRVRSVDGLNWQEKTATVVSQTPMHRPGMPIVRRLPSGSYVMVYEICAFVEADCAIFTRSSADGWDWGQANDLGERIIADTGNYFAHTPTLSLFTNQSNITTLILNGQILMDASGNQLAGTGQTLMISQTEGLGSWKELASSFEIKNVFNNYCPNYSSPVLAVDKGSSLLIIATNYYQGKCRPFYGKTKLFP